MAPAETQRSDGISASGRGHDSGPGSEPIGTPPRGHASRPVRDRVVGALARFLARGFYRSVEVEGTPPDHGPVILAASHLNGFVDPVLLAATLRIFPRFIAKATLWNITVARVPLDFLRVIPVHRRVDGGAGDGNIGTFDAAVTALAAGSVVAIFPEGTTHDDPTIRPIRTGIARIAVEAAAAGVEHLEIVPVGVSYEDKVSARGRAIVHFGEAVRVPANLDLVDDRGDPDHAVVRALTDEIQSSIEQVTPSFASTEDALALGAASEVVLRSAVGGDRPIPMAHTAEVSRRLAHSGATNIKDLVDLVARYHMRLGFVRLRDEDLAGDGRRRIVRKIAWLAILVAVLSPVAVSGLFINLIPVLLVVGAGMVPSAPVTKGTVRVLVAAVTFPLTWLVLAILDSDTGSLGSLFRGVTSPASAMLGTHPADRQGAVAGIVVFVMAPLAGLIAVLLADRLWVLMRSVRSWWTFVGRRGQLAEVREQRRAVIDATNRILSGHR